MKQCKKLISIFILAIMLTSNFIITNAQLSEIIRPVDISEYVDARDAILSISNSSTMLSVKITIIPRVSSTRTSGNVYIEQNRNGRWSSVKSLSISQTGTVSTTKTYTGVSGSKYRAKLVVNVGDDFITLTSNSVTLP